MGSKCCSGNPKPKVKVPSPAERRTSPIVLYFTRYAEEIKKRNEAPTNQEIETLTSTIANFKDKLKQSLDE